MPTYPYLVRPAGQAITPKRDALQARLGVSSLPPILLLSESLAATITDAEYIRDFCPPITTDGVTRYSPWCPPGLGVLTPNRDALQARLHVPSLPPIAVLSEALAATITNEQFRDQFCPVLRSEADRVAYERRYPWCGSPSPIPTPPTPPPSRPGPLVPGYAAGRVPPIEHYPTWAGAGYILGTEKNFLLELSPDDYYRMVDKFPTGGPAAFHQAVRVEATRHDVTDPLAGIAGLDALIAAQQTDYAGRGTLTTPAARKSALVPVLVVTAAGLVLWWLWPKTTRTRASR